MKFLRKHPITLFYSLILANTIFTPSAPAVSFDQQEVEQSQVIAIARPYGEGQYDLLILQQIPGQRQCWSESGSNPTTVEPLLLNFDFTGICDRSTDSNGYSIRLDGQDYGLNYLLRVVKRNGELVLVGTPRTDPTQAEIVVGSTKGIVPGFLKISLAPGWRFTRRAYQGKVLSHIYLTGDSSAINSPETQQLPIATDTTNSAINSKGKIREITITAGEGKPKVVEREAHPPLAPAGMGKANQGANAVIPVASPSVLPPLLRKTLPTSSATKTPLPTVPTAIPATSATSFRPASSSKTLPPPPTVPNAAPAATVTSLPPNSSLRNPPPLPSFSQLPPLPPPSSGGNSQVVPPPSTRQAATNNRQNLPGVYSVSPRRSPANDTYSGNASATNLGTTSYRVMVQANNRSQQEKLRSLYPDAFPIRHQGQSFWQIGVFSSQENADSALQNLQNLGFEGNVVQR